MTILDNLLKEASAKTSTGNLTTTDILKAQIKTNPSMLDAFGGSENLDNMNFEEMGKVYSTGNFQPGDFAKLTAQLAYTVITSPSFGRIYDNLFSENNKYGTYVRDIAMELLPVNNYTTDKNVVFKPFPGMYQELLYENIERKFWALDVTETSIQDAFQSEGAMQSFLSTQINTILTSKNVYEYERVNLEIQRSVNNGEAKNVKVKESGDKAKDILTMVSEVKKYAQKLQFVNRFNAAKVQQTVNPENLLLLKTIDFNVDYETLTLAGAFNPDAVKLPESNIKDVETLGVDEFGAPIQAMLVDKRKFLFSQILDTIEPVYNAGTRTTTYFAHYQNRFNMSQFADMLIFTFGDQKVEETVAFENYTVIMKPGDTAKTKLILDNVADVKAFLDENGYKLGVFSGYAKAGSENNDNGVFTIATDDVVDGRYVSAKLDRETGEVTVTAQPNAAEDAAQSIVLVKSETINGQAVNSVKSSQIVLIQA